MKWLLSLALLPSLLFASDATLTVPIRGNAQVLDRLAPTGAPQAAVLFLPGDGGWGGLAVTMGRQIASWGYVVYGFETKSYLEMFSQDGRTLSREQMAEDVRTLASSIAGTTHLPVILVGWSQGAAMAVAAAADSKKAGEVRGVLTLGLPESAVLGWDWKATLAIIARREPNQPHFAVLPLLPKIAPKPIWMVHGTEDEYTPPRAARAQFDAASEPKKLEVIGDADHRFSGHRDALYASIKRGLAWIATQ
ncbi:MAG: AcvB/VirJ family lysyl-phosphatidylglycerol hydrolase [Acidobacteriota bacterium]